MRCKQTLIVESDVLKCTKEGILGQAAARGKARDVKGLKIRLG